MRDPVLAGVLSLIIPGVGQLYNDEFWQAFSGNFTPRGGTGGTPVDPSSAAYCALFVRQGTPDQQQEQEQGRSRSRSRSRTGAGAAGVRCLTCSSTKFEAASSTRCLYL
jgi:hypothetical protein